MSRLALTAMIFGATMHQSTAFNKQEAAEWRGYDGLGCKGNYTVDSAFVMSQCTSYILLGQSSMWINQTNDTAFVSYHYSKTDDCTGELSFSEPSSVGACQDSPAIGPYKATSYQYVWSKAPSPPTSTCNAPGVCGRAYQTCCFGAMAIGDFCKCHLHNGTGHADAQDCGKCGKAFVTCCDVYSLRGEPCGCDLNHHSKSAAAAVVV